MSKSLKEILSTPIKDTTVSEIRLQVVVGLPLPLIIIYFISLFSPYFISFSFGFLVLGVYMFFIKNIENHFDLYSEEEISNIKTLSDKVTKAKLVDLIYELSNLENDMKWSTQKTIMFQAGIIKLCSKEVGTGGNVEERLEKIENYLKSGKLQVASNSNNYNSNSGYASNTVNSSPRMQVTQNINTASINGVEQNTNSTGTSFMAKQPVNTKKYSNDLSKSWPKIVNDLKQNGKIVLYTNLMNTRAEQVSDTTVEIKFQKGMTAFGKAVLDKQENIKELSSLVSMACGKDMQIRYVSDAQNQQVVHNPEDDIQKLAKDADIPFNIM